MNTNSKAQAAAAIADVMRGLMNGETLPPSYSDEFGKMTALFGAFMNGCTEADRAHFGALAIGLLIDAASAKIKTDEVMLNYGARP